MNTVETAQPTSSYFVEALDLRDHVIRTAKRKIRAEYFTALKYIVQRTIRDLGFDHADVAPYIQNRLSLYYNELFSDVEISTADEHYCMHCLAMCVTKPWRTKYRFMIICDAALILLDKQLLVYATSIINSLLSQKRQKEITGFMSCLFNNQGLEKKHRIVSPLVDQYRMNLNFSFQPEQKIIVTANMSAGKSTLINALVGKPIARTSQEVCTGNVCYIYNKPYDDGNIHLKTQNVNMMASWEDLHSYPWDGSISIASFFTGAISKIPRICLIDTPGVDAVLYQEHSKRAHAALLDHQHDTVVYVVSPTRLGTDAEQKHLRWISKNLPKDKIIFVLNKLDDYRDFSDSIEESINGLRDDLYKHGFENPIICPISAYFSYLIKLKMTGTPLSEDEEDEYTLYAKKFKRPAYDLSRYYDVQCSSDDSEEILLSKRAGLYGLEELLYGGGL